MRRPELTPALPASITNPTRLPQPHRAFSLISEVPKSSPMKRSKMWIALFLTTAMVLTQVQCRCVCSGGA